jgi:hypothetical protein
MIVLSFIVIVVVVIFRMQSSVRLVVTLLLFIYFSVRSFIFPLIFREVSYFFVDNGCAEVKGTNR